MTVTCDHAALPNPAQTYTLACSLSLSLTRTHTHQACCTDSDDAISCFIFNAQDMVSAYIRGMIARDVMCAVQFISEEGDTVAQEGNKRKQDEMTNKDSLDRHFLFVYIPAGLI